jgi:hypothetical protein
MAISNLLPAGGANDNRPNIKQFFGKNPAVANDNVERVSSGMFTDTFVDSVVTTLHSLIEEIAKITDIAKSVVASFGAIVKSIKALNKDVTNRFRVLNNELNASKIDFIRTVLAIPKAEGMPKVEGAPVNINAPEAPAPKKEEDKGFDIGDLLASYLGLKGGGSIIRSSLGGLLTFFMSPAGIALMTFGGAFFLLYKGLDDLTKAIMNDPMFAALKRRSEGKTDLQEVSEAGKEVGQKLKGRPELQKGFKSREEAFYKEPGNSWGDGGAKLKVSDFKRFPKNVNGEEVGILNNKLKDGTVAINIQTGQKYGEIDEVNSVQGDVRVSNPIGAPTAPPAAPAGAPVQAAGPQAAAPAALGQTGAGSFGVSGVTGMGAQPAPAAPSGAPIGEVKKESNTEAPPPSGRPSLKGAVASAIPVPPAGPSGAGGAGGNGGVAVVKNSSVQNVGSTGGAETGGMTGQNLPMFARNDKLQGIFGRQTLQAHQ